jgi:hypothetical protein
MDPELVEIKEEDIEPDVTVDAMDDASMKVHLNSVHRTLLNEVNESPNTYSTIRTDLTDDKSSNAHWHEAQRSVFLRRNRRRKRELSINVDDSLNEEDLESYFESDLSKHPHMFSDEKLPGPIGKEPAISAHIEKGDRSMPAKHAPSTNEAQAIRDRAYEDYKQMMSEKRTEMTGGDAARPAGKYYIAGARQCGYFQKAIKKLKDNSAFEEVAHLITEEVRGYTSKEHLTKVHDHFLGLKGASAREEKKVRAHKSSPFIWCVEADGAVRFVGGHDELVAKIASP